MSIVNLSTMEEAKKPVQNSNTNIITNQQQDPAVAQTYRSKKRKLRDVDHLNPSPYFKIRALVKQLRPSFIQVLQTPDFRNCRAAHEIRIQLKLLVNLCKQMTSETDPIRRPVAEFQPSSADKVAGKQYKDRQGDGKQRQLFQSKQSSETPEEKKTPASFNPEMLLDDGHFRRSYIVGGSAFGWNFITFGGSTPVYYGVTKDARRNARKKSEAGDFPIETETSKAT